jgi:hypothetical protein
MTDKKQEVKEVEVGQEQGIELKDATVEQLKAGAFDIEQQIKALQRNYQVVLNELQSRMEKQ